MDWYESEVEQLVVRLREHVAAPSPVVFYGSSSIRMWDSLQADFSDARVVNCGFGGSTMEACAWFFARVVRPLNPSAVVLYAGDNDLGDGHQPEFVLEQLGKLLAQLDASGGPPVPLALLAIKPSPARWSLRGAIERTNAGLRARASERPCTRYVDVYTPMLERGQPRSELFLDDGLHLSQRGYALWREVLQRERTGIF
jgi:lysophospholipase L1-like esterase